jgi:hypothetical protein
MSGTASANPNAPRALLEGAFLVDWDNCLGRTNLSLAGALRSSASIRLLPLVAQRAAVEGRRAGLAAVDVLLYGGWNDPRSAPTRLAVDMAPHVRALRRRIIGVSLRPLLVTRMQAVPSVDLVGLLRLRPAPPRQKMVDAVLALDAVHLAGGRRRVVWVVSEDDDLVPGVAQAAIPGGSTVILLRDQPSPNHHLLRTAGVRIAASIDTSKI